MIFETTERAKALHARVSRFMDEHVFPNEALAESQIAAGDRWRPAPIVEALKMKAKEEGLWNLFLPESEYGAGLTNLEYAPLCVNVLIHLQNHRFEYREVTLELTPA